MIAALLVVALGVPQEEADRDSALFGDADNDADRDSALFDEPDADVREGLGISVDELEARLSDRLDDQQDPLALGGQLFLRLEYGNLENISFEDQSVSSPNLLDVYLDVQPTPRLRAYARGRVRNDFTRAESEEPGASLVPQTTGTGTLDTSAAQTSALLDQLWMKFDLLRRVYITFGRQRIRWGTGRFWNPTDFLNRRFRDPLAVFDERLGVGLLKLHLPVESLGWNFYAVGNFEGASRVGDIGGALRAELLFDDTEISVSSAFRNDQPVQIGLDLSSALGPLDVTGELALLYDDPGPYFRAARPGEEAPIDAAVGDLQALLDLDVPSELRAVPVDRSDEWIVQAVVGGEIQLPYTAQDSVFLGAEYFYFNVGQRDTSIYPALFLNGSFTPLYTSRHYAAVYASLPAPGDWNRTSFTVSTVANLSDRSALSRLDFSADLFTFATFNAYVSCNWGEIGEFRYRYRSAPATDLTSLPDPDSGQPVAVEDIVTGLAPDQAALAGVLLQGIRIDAPRFNAGVGLRMAL